MNDNVVIKELKEELIGDIILCEPITRKGKESLERLGLSPEDITSTYFYDHLYVTSKYDDKREFETTASNQTATDNSLYYQYTVDNIQFEELKERLRTFNARFCSNSPNEYPLLMLGVAGNGKSTAMVSIAV